ncbi:MAG: multifunctional oxoglutarate decarboxylase/oxoglutarate dehydrogenase thiamine pyrophosphate-binding subunit/dihydrolipoyllysine-residue succinyltransferase subunit, partial [Propionibacterium sp.]
MSSTNNVSIDDFGANSWLIEEMREAYQADPNSVDPSWRRYFEGNSNTQESSTTSAIPAPATASTKVAKAPKATAAQPANSTPAPAPAKKPTETEPKKAEEGPKYSVLRGAAMRTAKNMEASLTVPTATSVRSVPMKLVIDQRTMINNYLIRSTGGKVSFTHIIGYAMVKALKALPDMRNSYQFINSKPTLVEPANINLGLAIDLPKPDGSRQLLVPNIKGCENLNFAEFWEAYEILVQKARKNELEVSDFADTTASLTNPGGIGTNHSVPRLMNGQGFILGVGSIDYPSEFQGASESRINELGISKITTLTSTYDHRVIQGALSGEFLKYMHELLIGKHDFYDEIFSALKVPYPPLQWSKDVRAHRENQVVKQSRVIELIQAYRTFGHFMANIDPLEYKQRTHPDLQLEAHGLTIWDLDRQFAVGTFAGTKRNYLSLREVLKILRDSYCHTIGVEYMHIAEPEERKWFQGLMEKPHEPLTHEEHIRTLDKLNEAEIFETFLQTKFVGQKRFSLEGGESVIVLLNEICDNAAEANLDEVCIGMPHRGRLNVLANIIGKEYSQIFREFAGNIDPSIGTGDVKYHLGAEGEFKSSSGKTIKASVAANPSHLEAVDPVLVGIARAKQDHVKSDQKHPVLPILLHGDAAFSGQGIVYETLQMSQLRGYKVGGTIHIVVNNQVGFTTAPSESRSSIYCTDVAKVVSAPVLHVNGDDPDACVRAARIALNYRQQFNKDVVIDLVCYRRRGHNEGDDPSFTQPKMYDLIEQKRSTRHIYAESMIGRKDITREEAEDVMNKFRERLESIFQEMRDISHRADSEYRKVPYYPTKPQLGSGTAISTEMMTDIAAVHTTFPADFNVHPKVRPQLERRAQSILNGPIDWATAEILAFGSLLLEGRPVRITGQDTRRGTFSQRFAAIVDRQTNEEWVPLKHVSSDQAPFDVYDSLLSEYAVMGFEYGYSVASPETLVLWEAQFGDFANGAQTIADEFISSADAKWTQKSGVVLLLPHGYEGQGPDHSSARIERWLQLCSEGALAVCQPSTPANHFHLLRQHAYVNWHRPVIIATPKSMLRNKAAVSTPQDFTDGRWQPAIDDASITAPQAVQRLLFCSGKIRWELAAERAKRNLEGKVAIISLERLYPLPDKELAKILTKYRHVTDIHFVQDEPENQGAWSFMQQYLPAAVA